MSSDVYIQISADRAMITTLLYAVNFAYEKWPGGDPDQQKRLDKIRSGLFAASLEFEVD